MNALFVILTVLIILAAILLIVVVLLQNGKGEGMASNFVAGNQTFGVRQTADFLEKLTWGLAATIIVLCIVANFVIPSKKQQNTSDLKHQLEQTEAATTPEDPAGTLPIEGTN